MRRAFVHRLPMAAPDDVSAIAQRIADDRIEAAGIVGILGKTEGNGCVNDFTRGFATQSLSLMLRRHLPPAAADAVCLVMSGGTEGGMAPHWTVFERREAAGPESRALAIGRAHTPALRPKQLGRVAQAELVAEGVRAAMQDAGITDPADVHFVQVKCPLLTAARIAEAEARGATVAVRDTLKSMALSRGASALGVALALRELLPGMLTDAAIGSDWTLFSSRASASSGIELMGHEILVLGMAAGWCGPLAIDHAVMADAIDTDSVRTALTRLGLTAPGQLPPGLRGRLVALLAKAEAAPGGTIRGHRHTMLDDSDIAATRHARGFVCGVLAGLIGHAEFYVSGGAEHQGPAGGGPVAVIVHRD